MMESELPPGSCNSTGHMSTIGYHTYPGRMQHSASTPAGVDGGARTPPATPKKGGKMLAVRVQMLDDSISMFQIQSKALGRVLFEQVCRQLHLLEADYFGLEYQDHNGTKYWVDVEKPLCRQAALSLAEPALRFCVKFYTADPARLEEEFTRYLFCLQVKRDLAAGLVHCNHNTAALMASYIVQAECGDFVPEDYPDHSYLSGYKFYPGQDADAESRIMENHKKHIGQSPAEADLNLLETARRCELYGIKMHSAKDHEGVPLNLAVANMGIVVFQNFTKINTFSWAKIRKISFKRKKFLIKLHPDNYGYYRDVVEFFFEGRNECKNFWKKCVENHGFFRCSSVARQPRQKARVISRGSSFRYSGKTQKQIVEFVRDNYVRRQTFHRSGSFRAPRSLRASGDVCAAGAGGALPAGAPRLNASLSAHPLLPLPPGSDAISLEWDKQPHYLEASLMVAGYSAEEARAAAARGERGVRARPALRPEPRPLLAPTAYATTRDKEGPELVTRVEVNHRPTEDSPLPRRMTTQLISPEENTWVPAMAAAGVCEQRTRARGPDEDDEESPDEDRTVSSASLCMSPRAEVTQAADVTDAHAPLCASTPRVLSNGHAKHHDSINGNDNVLTITECSSMDVLSCGESDAGDTLSRRNNNSMTACAGAGARARRSLTYCVAKELLMTERTYKRDLELVTVTWSARVSALGAGGAGGEELMPLARAALALEPLALAQGALLARLERGLAHRSESDEPEYKKIADVLYDYLSNIYDPWMGYSAAAGGVSGGVERERRRGGAGARALAAFEAQAMPLPVLLLRPLHRADHYLHLAQELCGGECGRAGLRELCARMARRARAQLRHIENHLALCALQRDIAGYDKLLVPNRELVRLGCVYKHSSKGLQQRMLFLFSDVLVVCARGAGGRFRALAALPLATLALHHDHPCLTLSDEEVSISVSGSTEQETASWHAALQEAVRGARDAAAAGEVERTVGASDGEGAGESAGGALWHVCWHRAASLSRDHLHVAMRSHMSGYLLRKFKNSHGWQKLWVVFGALTLYFYKSWQDDKPLASLPLLGYSVCAPSPADGISKEFVFKLQFKNHVYFFRADSQYTYNRWTEVLSLAEGDRTGNNNNNDDSDDGN